MSPALATLAVEPVRLIKADSNAASMPAAGWLVGAVVILTAIFASWFLIRARRARDDKELVFTSLARRLHLPRPAQRLIRRLALAHGAATPVALLLSDHALRKAVGALDQSQLPRADQRALDHLRKTFGLEPAP